MANESIIYIFSDGPRPGDECMVETVRSYLQGLEGFKKIKIIERKENWGVEKSEIEGMSYKKNATIIRYKTWSSHIQGLELIKMLKGINTNLIILHHSDCESKYDFRDFMEEDFRLSGISTKIVCADENNKLFFI